MHQHQITATHLAQLHRFAFRREILAADAIALIFHRRGFGQRIPRHLRRREQTTIARVGYLNGFLQGVALELAVSVAGLRQQFVRFAHPQFRHPAFASGGFQHHARHEQRVAFLRAQPLCLLQVSGQAVTQGQRMFGVNLVLQQQVNHHGLIAHQAAVIRQIILFAAHFHQRFIDGDIGAGLIPRQLQCNAQVQQRQTGFALAAELVMQGAQRRQRRLVQPRQHITGVCLVRETVMIHVVGVALLEQTAGAVHIFGEPVQRFFQHRRRH